MTDGCGEEKAGLLSARSKALSKALVAEQIADQPI